MTYIDMLAIGYTEGMICAHLLASIVKSDLTLDGIDPVTKSLRFVA